MILNKSRKTEISSSCIICKSSFSKARGLMFRLKPKTLVFAFEKEKKVPLHMMFVFFPIDVLYLSEKKEVVEIKENFMPFSFFSPSKKAKYVIELPAGTAKMSGTRIGDKISFDEN